MLKNLDCHSETPFSTKRLYPLRLDLEKQMGDDVIDKYCITLDSRVKFKLWAGIRAGFT